jgi:hypothetical protein
MAPLHCFLKTGVTNSSPFTAALLMEFRDPRGPILVRGVIDGSATADNPAAVPT